MNDKQMWPGLGGRAFWEYARKMEAFSPLRQGTKPNLGPELHDCMMQVKPSTLCTLIH